MQTIPELIESLRDWKKLTRSEILLIMAKIQDAQCQTCDGCGMIPGTMPDDDVMNTPCPDCNKPKQPAPNTPAMAAADAQTSTK